MKLFSNCQFLVVCNLPDVHIVRESSEVTGQLSVEVYHVLQDTGKGSILLLWPFPVVVQLPLPEIIELC
jgi:hypothetical protein